MANSTKPESSLDEGLTLKYAFNEQERTLGISSFITGKVGRKITRTVSTTTLTNDTETYSYLEDGVLLFDLRIIYADSAKTELLSVERIS